MGLRSGRIQWLTMNYVSNSTKTLESMLTTSTKCNFMNHKSVQLQSSIGFIAGEPYYGAFASRWAERWLAFWCGCTFRKNVDSLTIFLSSNRFGRKPRTRSTTYHPSGPTQAHLICSQWPSIHYFRLFKFSGQSFFNVIPRRLNGARKCSPTFITTQCSCNIPSVRSLKSFMRVLEY